MAKLARDADGLTAKEAKFALLLAQGATGAAAFRTTYAGTRSIEPKACWEGASRLRARSNVAARIRELLSQAKLRDLDSAGQAVHRSLELIEQSRENGNFSAAAKVNSDVLKMHGMLRDSLVVTHESSLTDAQLIDRLSQGDPKRLHAAQQLLRAPSSFAKVVDDPTVIDLEPVQDSTTNEQDQ